MTPESLEALFVLRGLEIPRLRRYPYEADMDRGYGGASLNGLRMHLRGGRQRWLRAPATK